MSIYRRPQLWAGGVAADIRKNVLFTSKKFGKTCEIRIENPGKTCYAIRFSKRGYRKDGAITNLPLYLAGKMKELL